MLPTVHFGGLSSSSTGREGNVGDETDPGVASEVPPICRWTNLCRSNKIVLFRHDPPGQIEDKKMLWRGGVRNLTSIILLDMRRETPSSVGTGCHRSAGFPTQEQDQGPFAFSEKKGMKARAQINGEQHFAITGSLPNSRKSNLGSWTFVAVLVHGVGGKKPKISPLSKTLSCYLFLAVVVVIRATGGGGSDVEAAVAVAAAMVRKRKLPRWRSDTLL